MSLVDKIEGVVTETKGKIEQKVAEVTKNDQLKKEGLKDELIGKLQIKLEKTKQDYNNIVKID